MIIRRRAFTLLEMLVASAVFAIVMVSIYSAFRTGLFSRQNIEMTIDTTQTARTILEQMNTDLRNAFDYEGMNNASKFTGSASEVIFLATVDTFRQDSMVREPAQVSYTLQQGASPRENQLLRLCKRGLDALSNTTETQPEEMTQGVNLQFKYGYLIPGEEDNGIQFDKDSWGISDNDIEKKSLPLAVKVALTLISADGKTERPFERTIYLPLARHEP